MYIKTREAMYV